MAPQQQPAAATHSATAPPCLLHSVAQQEASSQDAVRRPPAVGDAGPGRRCPPMAAAASAPLRRLTVALDWTPNTNHTGFYVACRKGWFAEAGLEVTLRSPSEFKGSYSGELSSEAAQDFPTPCGKVAAGEADFGINSPEGCVGWNTPAPGSARPKLQAVAALLQAQTSAIVTGLMLSPCVTARAQYSAEAQPSA